MPLRGDDNMFSVRRPGEAGMNAKDRPRFLRVTVEVVVDGSFFAALDIVKIKNGFQSHAADESDCFPVGRNLRTNRAARLVDVLFGFSCLHIKPLDRVDNSVRVFVVLKSSAGTDIFAVI